MKNYTWRNIIAGSLVVLSIVTGFVAWNNHQQEQADEASRNSPAGKVAALKEEQKARDDADVMVAKALVQAQLRDPDSAQLLGVEVVTRDGQRGSAGS